MPLVLNNPRRLICHWTKKKKKKPKSDHLFSSLSLSLSIYIYTSVHIYLSISLCSCIYLSRPIPFYLSPFVYPSLHLSLSLSLSLSLNLSTYLSIYVHIYFPLFISINIYIYIYRGGPSLTHVTVLLGLSCFREYCSYNFLLSCLDWVNVKNQIFGVFPLNSLNVEMTRCDPVLQRFKLS